MFPGSLLPAALMLVVCLFAVTALDREPSATRAQGPPNLESLDTTCQEGLRCGYVTVDRPHLNGNLRLWVAAAGDPAADAVPLVVLPGGPGSPGAGTAAFAMELFPTIADDRLVLHVDPRGTGLSDGRLSCPIEPLGDWQECFEHIAETAEVDLYSSESIADDVEALRVALEIEEWDVHGGSYGAEVAQHLLRRHPNHIRSAVLIHPASVAVAQPTDYVETLKVALRVMADDCERDPACAGVASNIEQRWLAVLDHLTGSPIQLAAHLGPVQLDGVAGANFLRDLLLGWSSRTRFVEALESLERRDPSVWDEHSTWRLQRPDPAEQPAPPPHTATLVHNITLCLDGLASAPPIPYEPGSWEHVVLSSDERQPTACKQLGIAETTIDMSPVISDVPTLVMAGRTDSITAVDQARSIVETLSIATLVEFPWYGHEGLWSDPCPQQIVTDFWNQPSEPVDQGCLADLTFEAVNREEG